MGVFISPTDQTQVIRLNVKTNVSDENMSTTISWDVGIPHQTEAQGTCCE